MNRQTKVDFANYESEQQTHTFFPPHPEEGTSTCVYGSAILAWRPSQKDGRPHGSRRRARSCGIGGRPKIAAPHHEAERDRVCIKN